MSPEPATAEVRRIPRPEPLAVPTHLPVRSDGKRLKQLSASSIALFWRCPERWRRRYLEREREPVAGPMLVGRAVGAAVTAHYAARIRGESLSAKDCDDLCVVEFDDGLLAPDLQLADDDPAELKANAREALAAYLTEIAPGVEPAAVERKIETRFDGAEWSIVSYLDLEDQEGIPIDLKVGAKHVTKPRADKDAQASTYLLARAVEGRAAERFDFHSVRRGAVKSGARCTVIDTTRTPGQVAAFEHRLALTARGIAHCDATGDWPHSTPEGWWCSQSMCAFWASCEAGGAR